MRMRCSGRHHDFTVRSLHLLSSMLRDFCCIILCAEKSYFYAYISNNRLPSCGYGTQSLSLIFLIIKGGHHYDVFITHCRLYFTC